MLSGHLAQFLPAEVADQEPTLGISDVNAIDGKVAIANIDDKHTVIYQFRLSIEIVVDGEGKVV